MSTVIGSLPRWQSGLLCQLGELVGIAPTQVQILPAAKRQPCQEKKELFFEVA